MSASGPGSLVEAISLANTGAYRQIDIQSGLGPISLSAQMLIYADVTISGNGNVIDMNNADRAFFIVGGEVNISNLTIQNGSATRRRGREQCRRRGRVGRGYLCGLRALHPKQPELWQQCHADQCEFQE